MRRPPPRHTHSGLIGGDLALPLCADGGQLVHGPLERQVIDGEPKINTIIKIIFYYTWKYA